jgi:H2-forming N5,N10-methylenetetrahydromethanopterin dehydrogenase-like enzyme
MPKIWNQGGYDGIYLEKTNGRNVIRFVQTTTKDSHDVKLDFFIKLINKLKASNVFDAHEVEIFFVVPTHKLVSYKIRPISHPESLELLYWPTYDEEVPAKIQILG